MKLSWQCALSMLFLAAGGAIVFANIQEYSWWPAINNWRLSIIALAVLGLAAYAVTTHRARKEDNKRILLDDVDLAIGIIAADVAIAGLILASELLFYLFAVIIGVVWLISVARNLLRTPTIPTASGMWQQNKK